MESLTYPDAQQTLRYAQHRRGYATRAQGKLRLEGKDYVVQDGDILHIRFNVGK